jgi:hypothetical protein
MMKRLKIVQKERALENKMRFIDPEYWRIE